MDLMVFYCLIALLTPFFIYLIRYSECGGGGEWGVSPQNMHMIAAY